MKYLWAIINKAVSFVIKHPKLGEEIGFGSFK